MPNIASVFKDEISRIARKEVRSEITSLKKASTAHRAEIAALKKRALNLEQELRRANKSSAKPGATASEEGQAKTSRFSAKGLASHRKRLELSAHDFGALVGASGQSIYNWEAGSARPRAAHIAAIAVLKSIGKKEAALRLTALRSV
jgi:DNA-binding transcriptional regulator YiaG